MLTSAAGLQSLPGFPKASAMQRRILKASDDGFRTPLFNNQDAEAVLNEWSTRVENSIFKDLEMSELGKAGPYYNYPFKEWRGKVDAYFHHDPGSFEVESRLKVIMDRFLSWLTPRISRDPRPYDLQNVFQRSRKNTNLGYPLVTSDWGKVNSYLDRAQRLLDGKEERLFPYVLFKRVQPGGFDRAPEDRHAKQRPVWGADHAETFTSLALVYPLLDAFKQVPGFEHLNGVDALEVALSDAGSRHQHFVSLDFSACDATFGPGLISAGLYLMSALLNYDTPMSQLWHYYTRGEIHTPVGLMAGSHGIPSGIGVTNIIETLVLRGIIGDYLEVNDIGSFDNIYQNGDDGVIMSNAPIAVDHLSSYLAEFGLVMNREKSLVDSDRFMYLQRHFYRDYGFRAVMSTTRMLGRILFAERAVSESSELRPREYWTLNTIMKLENCKRSDIFASFVEFVMGGDKYNLSVQGLENVSTRIVQGYSVFEDDDARSGIMSFDTVQLLSSLTPGPTTWTEKADKEDQPYRRGASSIT